MITPNETHKNDLIIAQDMMRKGQRAASIDGIHLIIWGGVVSCILFIQYFAEVSDWLPSATLWLWQPIAIILVLISLLIGKRSFVNRAASPIIKTYMAAFGITGAGLLFFVICSLFRGRPDPFIFALLLSASLGTAFFIFGVVTDLRKLCLAALGWWSGFCYFSIKGHLTPIDFITLAFLMFFFVCLPGVYLRFRHPQKPITLSEV